MHGYKQHKHLKSSTQPWKSSISRLLQVTNKTMYPMQNYLNTIRLEAKNSKFSSSKDRLRRMTANYNTYFSHEHLQLSISLTFKPPLVKQVTEHITQKQIHTLSQNLCKLLKASQRELKETTPFYSNLCSLQTCFKQQLNVNYNSLIMTH